MSRDLDQKLLGTFADLTEAQYAQAVLEGEGIPCRVGDLDQIPSVALTGGMGMLARSTGIWVLAVDLERAAAVLADLRSAEGAVDIAALAREAAAAAPVPGAAGARSGAPPDKQVVEWGGTRGASRFSPAAQLVAWIFLVVVAVALLGRWW